MDENLLVISYWKVCGLSQNEISERIENKLNSQNFNLIATCETDTKKGTNCEMSNNEPHLDSVHYLNESIKFNKELKNDLKSFDWSCLLPSNCLKNSKFQEAEIEKLDKIFQSSFEMGVKQGESGLECEIKHNEDFNEEHEKLYKAWSDAGYKTGIAWNRSSNEAEKDFEA